MTKKKLRKPVVKRKKGGIVVSRVRIIFFAVAVLMVGLVVRSIATTDHYKILGASTLFARGGDESGGGDSGGSGSGGSSSGGGSESSDSGGSSGSGSSGGGSNESGSGSSGSGGGGSESGGSGENEKPEAVEPPEAPEVENEVEAKDTPEETEVEVPEDEKIRTLTKDGNLQLDITSGKIKTRFEIKDDKVVVKAEQADGTEVELEEDSLAKIDDRLEKDNIKVATAGASKFLVQKGTAGAVTDFPVSVDLATNTLFVNTPNGQKEIAILPEQAIQNMIKAGIISSLGDKPAVAGANTNVSSVGQLVILGEKNGIPAYEINGVSDQKLLGFIPVKIQKDVVVSGQTGSALSIDQSFGVRILDALSF